MKRTIGVVLACVLAISMPLGAMASVSPGSSSSSQSSSSSSSSSASASSSAPAKSVGSIKGVATANFAKALAANGDKGLIRLDNKAIKSAKLTDLEVSAGNEIKIYLTNTMFVDSAGAVLPGDSKNEPVVVTRDQIRGAKITLRRSSSQGSKAFQSVAIKYDNKGAYIGITFVDPFVSIKELDFSTTLYLNLNGKRVDASKITISGTLENVIQEIYADVDYVDLSDGWVGEAIERIAKIEIDLGHGLSMFTSIPKDRKVYATCSVDLSSADERVAQNHPGINYVYSLKLVNLKSTSKVVSIDVGTRMYAYDANGKYLDTTDKLLPLSQKYYLSDVKYDSIKLS